jgi:transposase InsO family protein
MQRLERCGITTSRNVGRESSMVSILKLSDATVRRITRRYGRDEGCCQQTPPVWLPADRCDAGTQRHDDEPQEAVSPLHRRKTAHQTTNTAQTCNWIQDTNACGAAPRQRWSLDFLSDTFGTSNKFRILAVIGDFCRANLCFMADTSISSARVARELDALEGASGSRSRRNQIWCADITYILMRRCFLCLVAIMDWFSYKVLAWRLSNSMDAAFCVEALKEAVAEHGTPDISNTE